MRHSAAPAGDDKRGLQVVAPVAAGEMILALGAVPQLWTVRPARTALARRAAPGDPWCVRRRAAAGLPARAGARRTASSRRCCASCRLLSPAAPRRHQDVACPIGATLEVALPDGEGGLFLRGWLRDPLSLVAGGGAAHARWRPPRSTCARCTGSAGPTWPSASPARRSATTITRLGFVAHLPDPSGGACLQPTLALRLGSGAVVEVTAPLRHVPAAAARGCGAGLRTAGRGDGRVAGPMPRAGRRGAAPHARSPGRVRRRWCGSARRSATPAVTIIVPLYRNLGFLRFQLAAFAADPECRAAELIYRARQPGAARRGRASAARPACPASAAADAGGDAAQPRLRGREQCRRAPWRAARRCCC